MNPSLLFITLYYNIFVAFNERFAPRSDLFEKLRENVIRKYWIIGLDRIELICIYYAFRKHVFNVANVFLLQKRRPRSIQDIMYMHLNILQASTHALSYNNFIGILFICTYCAFIILLCNGVILEIK